MPIARDSQCRVLSVLLVSAMTATAYAQDDVGPPRDPVSADEPSEETLATRVPRDLSSVDTSLGTDSLTPLHYWSPPYATRFVTAATCHSIFEDWYGIAAVFHISWEGYEWDELHYLRVDGLSWYGAYGELAHTTFIDWSYDGITNVDCTTDDWDRVFIAWDRRPNASTWKSTARLASINYDTVEWTAQVGTHIAGNPLFPSYVYRPRVAWSPYGRLVVATNVALVGGEPAGCGLFFETFTDTGSRVDQAQYFDDDSKAKHWDIEYDGAQHFVSAFWYELDLSPDPNYITARLNLDGTLVPGHQTIESRQDHMPQGMVLVYSDNYHNMSQYFVAMTSKNVYYLYQDGRLRSARDDWNGSAPNLYAGCEYWGPSYRIAHSYVDSVSAPIHTKHMHWYWSPQNPYEVYSVMPYGWVPVGCASSDTFTDPEVLLVRKTWSVNAYVYWTMEPED
ncbi:MAG: hypothetical protein HY825_15480 [Acidobacteria bacterium]|nr:hypothetical protein [Acidobacteriota bacterium]